MKYLSVSRKLCTQRVEQTGQHGPGCWSRVLVCLLVSDPPDVLALLDVGFLVAPWQPLGRKQVGAWSIVSVPAKKPNPIAKFSLPMPLVKKLRLRATKLLAVVL